MSNSDAVVEELAKLIEALVEDEDLRAWFEHMATVSESDRRAEFIRVAGEMRRAGEHEELIRATTLLAESGVYEAVRQTVAKALTSQTA